MIDKTLGLISCMITVFCVFVVYSIATEAISVVFYNCEGHNYPKLFVLALFIIFTALICALILYIGLSVPLNI